MEPGFVPLDLQRIFLGDYPPLFYAEVLLRVVVIYGYTLLLIRWIGGRGVAQLSLVEFLLVIALGSAVGDAMFYEDVPLIVAMAVITLVVVINKLLDKAIVHSQRAEALIDGKPLPVLRDGVLEMRGLHARELGTDELKAALRTAGVSNLGQVSHAYLEVNGRISIFRAEVPRLGLAIVPPAEIEAPPLLADAAAAPGGRACCCACGQIAEAAAVVPDAECPNCGTRCWTIAVQPPVANTVPEA